jgi:hypothetical protein
MDQPICDGNNTIYGANHLNPKTTPTHIQEDANHFFYVCSKYSEIRNYLFLSISDLSQLINTSLFTSGSEPPHTQLTLTLTLKLTLTLTRTHARTPARPPVRHWSALEQNLIRHKLIVFAFHLGL